MRQNVEIHLENPPCYLVMCDYQIFFARTMEEAIDFCDSHYELCEIFKRHGTTGPVYYDYLCDVTKQKGGDLNGVS